MRYLWFVIFVLSIGSVFAQNSARVRELEKQRKAALAEIEMTSQLLDETRQTARNSLNRLNLLSKQILSRKQVISLLNQEIGEIDKQIASSRRNISQLEKELGNKRQNYGKSVQSMYKRRSSQDKLLFILSADNFAQSLRRMRYLREYADWQKKQASEIIDKQKEIADKQKELEKTRSEKNALLGAREDESRKLQTEESSQKEEVQQLNKKQKQLQADLKKKITEERQKEADRAFENTLMEQVAEKITADIPDAMVEAQARQFVDNFKMQIAQSGIPYDQYLKMTGTEMGAFRAMFQSQAERQVKTRLALQKVVELEGITVSDKELEEEYAKMAEQYKMEVEKVKAIVSKEALEGDLKISNALEFIKKNAKVKKAAKKKAAEETAE